MERTYERINWENEPSIMTPINEINLNKMDAGLYDIDGKVVELDVTKTAKSDSLQMFNAISYDEKTGKFTFTRMNGTKVVVDTLLEKVVTNFRYDPTTQQLILTTPEGESRIDLSALITQYEFLNSENIQFVIEGGKVKARVIAGSIKETDLDPQYLAEITEQVESAHESASRANTSAILAESYAKGETGTREGENTDNAKYYKDEAKSYKEQAAAIVGIDIATTKKAGIVKPDGTTITIEADGTIKVPKVEGVQFPLIQATDICQEWRATRKYKKGDLCYGVFYQEDEVYPNPPILTMYVNIYVAIKDNINVDPFDGFGEYWGFYFSTVAKKVTEETTDTLIINGTQNIDGAEGNIQSITFYGNTEKVNDTLVTPQGKVENLGSKNLFDISKISLKTVVNDQGVFTVSPSSTSNASDYIKVSQGKYTISYKRNDTATYLRIIGFDQNKSLISTPLIYKGTDVTVGNKEETFDVPSGVYYIRFAYSEHHTNIMLNSGEMALPYEPYKGSLINASEIAPDKPLYGIGDIKNTLEVFADGSGVYTQRVKGVKLSTIINGYASQRFFTSAIADMKASTTRNADMLCDRYDVNTSGADKTMFNSNRQVFIYDSRYTNVASLVADLGDTVLLYLLETPIITPLTSKEVAEFLSLKTFNNSTITTDAETEIVYYKNNGNGQTIASIGDRVNDNAYTKSMISDEYDKTKTYSQGEYCISNNSLWKSKVNNNLGNVPTEGSYWTASNIGSELGTVETTQVGNLLYEKCGKLVTCHSTQWIAKGDYTIPDGFKPKNTAMFFIPVITHSSTYSDNSFVSVSNGKISSTLNASVIIHGTWFTN